MHPAFPDDWPGSVASITPHSILRFDGAYAVWLEGPDRFEEEVVGESFYQPQLERVTSHAELQRTVMRVGAWLMPQLDNPHDRTSVMVWIQGGIVGHLPRARAALWHPVLRALQRRYRLCPACHAEIRGGWRLRRPDADGRTHAYYGVKLYLPIRLAAPESTA